MTRPLHIPSLATIKGFGNSLLFYAHAKHLAESLRVELHTPPWPGRVLFDLHDPLISDGNGEVFSWQSDKTYEPRYSIEDFRRCLPFKPEVLVLAEMRRPHLAVHIRRGDFMSSKLWPQVSMEVIEKGVTDCGFDFSLSDVFIEEKPHTGFIPMPEKWMLDFVLMSVAKTLFTYPASSFSGCAGMLNPNAVYLPHGFMSGPTDCHWRLR